MYASLSDFVCIPLLLPFVPGSGCPLFFVCFCFFFKYSFLHLLSLVDLLFGLVALFFLPFFIFVLFNFNL